MNASIASSPGSNRARSFLPMAQGCWCLLFVVVGVLPAAAQVDQALAEQDLRRGPGALRAGRRPSLGRLALRTDGNRDAATGTIATSQPAPAGDRPRALGLVNAPVQWGGITWSVYNLASDPQG